MILYSVAINRPKIYVRTVGFDEFVSEYKHCLQRLFAGAVGQANGGAGRHHSRSPTMAAAPQQWVELSDAEWPKGVMRYRESGPALARGHRGGA